MLLDILAAQRLYGVATTGDFTKPQTFGFNTTLTGAVKVVYDFSAYNEKLAQVPVVTIWDSAKSGNVLDLSGFSTASKVDLTPGSFTSADGVTNNIAIAYDTIIGKTIGGSAADSFKGTTLGETFTGGGGGDTFSGGGGPDIYMDTAANLNGDTITDFITKDFINVLDASGSVSALAFASGVLSFTSGATSVMMNLSGFADATPMQRAGTAGGVDIYFGSNAPVTQSYSVSVAPGAHVEGGAGTGSAIVYSVTRADGTSAATVDVSFSGNATPPGSTNADYSVTGLTNGQLSFAAGATTATFTVSTTPDTLYEPDETVTATIGNSSDGGTVGTASASATITNDDTPPSLAISPAQVVHSEGNSGPTTYDFTITRTGDAQNVQTVAYAVTGTTNTPVDGSDFVGGQLPSGTLAFEQGETTKTLTILVNGDTDVEFAEHFNVALSNPNFGAITTASSEGVIVNDDGGQTVPTYSIAVAPNSVAEGTGGSGNTITYTVTRTGGTEAATVTVALGGTATPPVTGGAVVDDNPNPSDYTVTGLTNGQLSFAAGATTASFTVTTAPDAIFEPDETVTATLTDASGNGALGTTVATATIVNDDAAPSFAIAPAALSLKEGNTGSTAFTYTVTRSGDAQNYQTVNYAVTGSGTHPADANDFSNGGQLPSGTLTFDVGALSQTLTIYVSGDTTIEPSEGFTVTLSDPSFGSVATATASGTIVNDDDTTPPGAPTGLMDAAIKGGYVNADNNTAAQALTGAAEPGSTVTVYDGQAKLGTTTVDATSGAFSYTVGRLADGSHSLTATATDASDNLGPASAALSFVVDTIAPTAPGVRLTSDTGTSSTDRVTSDARITVVPAENGGSLSYVVDNGAATASYTAPTAQGAHTVSVTQTDAAGNISTASSLTFTLDTVPPSAPALALTSDTGASATDRITRDPTITYTASAAGDTLLYKADAGTYSTTAPAFSTDGSADGSHTVSVEERDAAGNVSAASSLTFTLDTKAPAAPTISLTLDSGTSTTDHLTNDPRVTVGAAEAGGTLLYTVDGTAVGTGYDPSHLADGAHTVAVVQIDTAGNASPAGSLAFTLDRTSPFAPTVALAHDTGRDGTDKVTADGTLTVASAEAGGTIEYSTNGSDYSATAPTYASDGSQDGQKTVSVRQTDAAGNHGAADAFAFSFDHLAFKFLVDDRTSGVNGGSDGERYSGPVAGLHDQLVLAGPDNVTVAPIVPNTFVKTGAGSDAIDVSKAGGTNVLDGGAGSNFLVGGKGVDGGHDTFFIDTRGASNDIWSTVVNFHDRDGVALFGVTSADRLDWADGQGTTGFQGLTLHVTSPSHPEASLTLAGYSTADLTNGHLLTSFGTEPDGTPYLYLLGTG